MTSLELAKKAVQSLDSKRGSQIKLILRTSSSRQIMTTSALLRATARFLI